MGKAISIPVWIKRGGMLMNTSCLPNDDPESAYQYIVRAGGIPSEYGIEDPLEKEFELKSRAELIQEIVELRKELDGLCRHFQV